jgi:hypothetical protein
MFPTSSQGISHFTVAGIVVDWVDCTMLFTATAEGTWEFPRDEVRRGDTARATLAHILHRFRVRVRAASWLYRHVDQSEAVDVFVVTQWTRDTPADGNDQVFDDSWATRTTWLTLPDEEMGLRLEPAAEAACRMFKNITNVTCDQAPPVKM